MTHPSLDTWPDLLRRFAEVIGPEATMRFVAYYGGLERIRVPKVARADHTAATLIGLEAWSRICQVWGGETIDVPRGHFVRLRKAEIIDLGEQGLHHREIARRTGTTQRYVRSVLGRRTAVDPRQTSLFDED